MDLIIKSESCLPRISGRQEEKKKKKFWASSGESDRQVQWRQLSADINKNRAPAGAERA